MEATNQDPRLVRDVFWAAMEACITRLKEQSQLVLFDKIPDHDQGLNVSTINRLACANGLTVIEHPIFSVERITEEGLEHERLLNVFDCAHDAPVTWKTWGRYKLNREINPHKLTRTIRYLKAWQAKRATQLLAAERQRVRMEQAEALKTVAGLKSAPVLKSVPDLKAAPDLKSSGLKSSPVLKSAPMLKPAPGLKSTAARLEAEAEVAWPPNGGWHFRPGEFAYMRQVHALKRKEWALLKVFARAKKALTENDLLKTVWRDEPQVGSDSIQTTISHLRSKLRKAFRVPKDSDPIPTIASGKRKAWKLDVKSLKST